MKKYEIIGYPDEEGNTKKSAIIEARSYDEAIDKAWRMFPEHHEVNAFEIPESKQGA